MTCDGCGEFYSAADGGCDCWVYEAEAADERRRVMDHEKAPTTPERREVLLLRRDLRRALDEGARLRLALALMRARRWASDAALNREHFERRALEVSRDEALERLTRERDSAREDEKTLSSDLAGIAAELDRGLIGAVPLKSPADFASFIGRVRKLIPTPEAEAPAPVKS